MASSSGPAQIVQLHRGRKPEGDLQNVAVTTITQQLSILQLRTALQDRGVYNDGGMTKADLAATLIDSDKKHWKLGVKQPLPKAETKSPKKQAEASLKALGVKGLK